MSSPNNHKDVGNINISEWFRIDVLLHGALGPQSPAKYTRPIGITLFRREATKNLTKTQKEKCPDLSDM